MNLSCFLLGLIYDCAGIVLAGIFKLLCRLTNSFSFLLSINANCTSSLLAFILKFPRRLTNLFCFLLSIDYDAKLFPEIN